MRALEPSAPFVRFGPSNVAPLREMRDDGPCRVDDVVKRALALQTFVSDFCYAGQLGLHVGQRVFQGSPPQEFRHIWPKTHCIWPPKAKTFNLIVNRNVQSVNSDRNFGKKSEKKL